jgi:TRAP-type mannitol/chloroaromatic compound transport system substrate-binding protein
VQDGTVEMANTAPYYYFGKDETFALGCAIPFGLNSRQMTAWYFEGNGLKLMREFYASYNIINFPMGNTGAQMGGWFRKEIKSLADMKGLKFRVGGFGGKVVERIGGVPQNIPGGEIYQALEKGTIDAAEWVGPYDDQKLGFNKVAPTTPTRAGGKVARSWTARQHQGLRRRCPPSTRRSSSARCLRHSRHAGQVRRQERRALKQLVAQGAKLFPFPKDLMDAAFKEAMAMYSEISAKNPAGRRSTTTTRSSAATQNLWFRFTEATSTTSCSASGCKPCRPGRRFRRLDFERKPRHGGAFFMAFFSSSRRQPPGRAEGGYLDGATHRAASRLLRLVGLDGVLQCLHGVGRVVGLRGAAEAPPAGTPEAGSPPPVHGTVPGPLPVVAAVPWSPAPCRHRP